MQKQIGAIMLISGTCIGSGMLALPMLLSKIGLIPSIILMLMTCFIIYYTSLINVEINLQAEEGLPLGKLGRKFSGKIAELIGTSSFKILSYSLLTAYLYAGSSVLQKMLLSNFNHEYAFQHITIFYAITYILLFLMPIKIMDYINRILFIGLLAVIAILIIGLASTINWYNLPLFAQSYNDISVWSAIIPVLFTSFGFQVIFHTLTNYCNKDATMLKKSFLWGSLIPALVYILWTCSILGVIYQENPNFYQEMINGKIDVGDLIKELSNISQWPLIQTLVWWLSIFAIVTSVLGVGLGLCDSIKSILQSKIRSITLRNILASMLTIMPAYLIATLLPNAFITIFGFAGMILVIIAIIMPIYLFKKIKIKQLNYSELSNKYLVLLSIIVGLIIISCQISNMFNTN